MPDAAILLIIGAMAVAAFHVFLYYGRRNGEWHESDLRSDDGRPQMERLIGDKWQYRLKTDEELFEDWQAMQW